MTNEFLGHQIEIPFAPAAGAINGPNLESIKAQLREIYVSPLQVARWASATYNGGLGNEPLYGRVYYHNELTGQTVNSLGLPSVSIEAMEQALPDLLQEAEDRGKILIPGVSAAAGDDPLEVLPEMAERLVEAGAERIELNYSCPNKITEDGGREAILSHDLETMIEVDEAVVARVGTGIWVVRKIAPLVAQRSTLIIPTANYFANVPGKVAISFNTVGGQSILTETGEPALQVPGNVGGLSGPATKMIGRNMLTEFRKRLPKRVQIDSALGVSTGAEIHVRVDELGADIASGVTVFMENEGRGKTYSQIARRIADQYYDAKEAALA